jgi:FkbH-like protein
VTQLINKTNQFNLTTRRMTEAEVQACMDDPSVVTVQVRLADRFGDNGVIAILIARASDTEAEITTWLMSCRVLGRHVEEACLNILAERCAGLGVTTLLGTYSPTEKNGMVREMYSTLGFTLLEEQPGGRTRWQLGLAEFAPKPVPMQIDGNIEMLATR